MSEQPLDDVQPNDRTPDDAWEDVPGWGYDAVRSVGFWLILLGVLALGVALGVYAIPGDLVPLPGSPDYVALTSHDARLAELESLAASHDELEAEILAAMEEASLETDTQLLMENPELALIYTVRVVEASQCAELVGFSVDGVVQTVRVSPFRSC